MLFSSLVFLFGFLPLALAGFALLGRLGRQAGAAWLVAASLVFYGWWEPRFLPILAASIAFNYAAAMLIRRTAGRPAAQSAVAVAAVAANLLALVYFKYLASLVGFLIGTGLPLPAVSPILLPLGISFFTFTQIGYLLDVREGVTKATGLLDYLLFVTFFPHLIAGPILHNREMMPQYADAATFRIRADNVTIGLAIFTIGLLKKTVLADPIAAIVPDGFAHPGTLGLYGAWHVALSYSLQLYFDFSGYSDMAIGLARMFNVRFPLNFNSPYKAASIIEYWQRWHMSLTRYLTLYLYNPIALHVTRRRVAAGLPITRKAYATLGGFAAMVAWPTLITMGLAGVWHGAGLQFVVFGLLHGLYLTINHGWRVFRRLPGGRPAPTPWAHARAVALTYGAVLIASVFFRASSCTDALTLLAGMLGLQGFGPGIALALPGPGGAVLEALGILASPGAPAVAVGDTLRRALGLVILYGIVWCAPNTQQIVRLYAPALETVLPWRNGRPAWQPTPRWAIAIGAGLAIGILATSGTAEFLYFQF